MVLESVGCATTVNEVAEYALESVRRAFGWEYGTYWTMDSAAGVLRFAKDAGETSGDFREATKSASFAESTPGKGFAVVASEVKELAKETARATEGISQKIHTIRTELEGLVAQFK